VFQLGNTSYRIQKVEQGKVYVTDAHGQPPTIPFWLGEAPGRSRELSSSVGKLNETIGELIDREGLEGAMRWLRDELGLGESAAKQLIDYLGAAKAALGVLPTAKRVVLERFFDETGDTHLVVHSPFGSRINRAWGLSLRKRFCRRFNSSCRPPHSRTRSCCRSAPCTASRSRKSCTTCTATPCATC
jgi:ATP-dependent Lhr-like helicase